MAFNARVARRPKLTMMRLWRRTCLLVCLTGLANGAVAAPSQQRRPAARARIGFTLHWDFVNSPEEADRLLTFAFDQGVEILNVVPPPHIWEDARSLTTLRRIFDRTREHGVAVVLNRIDGSGFAGSPDQRSNWLYSHVLTAPGRLPSGHATPRVFLATVGKPDYEKWLLQETAFYAEQFGGRENLLAFGVGFFNEPFVSQRGSLLCYDGDPGSYEIGQYTPFAREVYHHYLQRLDGGSLDALNRRYGSHFASLAEVPLPRDEHDPAFGDAARAYWDFASAINAWVVGQLDACRALWKSKAQRPVPFMLQFNGALAEKLARGRPAFAALDIFDWMSRADALGLSLYTDCGFPDWGHASARATVGFLGLARLLGKTTYVLESGSECHGAVLRPPELEFLARTIRPLAPASVIYEFTKTTYCEPLANPAGKLVDNGWHVNRRALRAVRRALARARKPDAHLPGAFVFDPLPQDPDARALARRHALMRLALLRPLTFVTSAALDALPPGSTLYLSHESLRVPLEARLAGRGVHLLALDALLPDKPRALHHY
jgi:hypothetical protein